MVVVSSSSSRISTSQIMIGRSCLMLFTLNLSRPAEASYVFSMGTGDVGTTFIPMRERQVKSYAGLTCRRITTGIEVSCCS